MAVSSWWFTSARCVLGALALPALLTACGGSSTSHEGDDSGGSSSGGSSGSGSPTGGTFGSGTGGSSTGGSSTGGSSTGGSSTGGSSSGATGGTASSAGGKGGTGAGGTGTGGAGTGGAATGGSSGVAGTSGAGGSLQAQCETLCRAGQSCPDSTPVDCASECRTALADTACVPELQDFLDCWASVGACDPGTNGACYDQAVRYASCEDGTQTGTCGGTPATPASCQALCAQSAQCPGNEGLDCATECDKSVGLATMAGCSAEYQDLLDCVSTCSDLCNNTLDDCSAEADTAGVCLSTYCVAHPDEPACSSG